MYRYLWMYELVHYDETLASYPIPFIDTVQAYSALACSYSSSPCKCKCNAKISNGICHGVYVYVSTELENRPILKNRTIIHPIEWLIIIKNRFNIAVKSCRMLFILKFRLGLYRI